MIDVTLRPPSLGGGGAIPSRISISPGGLANVAIAARAMGVKTGFLGRVGRDAFGEAYMADLSAHGIDAHLIRSELPTGICVNFVTPDGERTMYTSQGANSLLTPEDLRDEDLSGTEMIFVSGFAMETESGANTIEEMCRRARKLAVKVAIGGGAHNLIALRLASFRRIVKAYSDILILNLDEAQALTGLGTEDEISGRLGRSVDLVVVTRGAEGSFGCLKGEAFRYPAPESTVVDTTGAGDIFAGTLLGLLLKRKPVKRAIPLAHRAASASVQTPGPRSILER
jgi:sugar/nucleoside kinase (ribokinase family)